MKTETLPPDAIPPDAITNPAVHAAIAQRAYELWEKEGTGNGCHERHWAEAERQVNGAIAPEVVKPLPPVEAPAELPADVPQFPLRKAGHADRREN